jgi:hypothetical protein
LGLLDPRIQASIAIGLEPDFMESQQPPKWVVPSPQIPRTFGILNIVFGAVMLLVGLGYAFWYFYAPTFTKQMQAQVEQTQAKRKAERAAELAKLKREVAAAKTEDERKFAKDAREAYEAVVEPDIGDINDLTGMSVFTDRRLAAFYWTEVSTGILLNVLMITSGIGLVMLAEWARKLALGVCCLKILRWIFVAIITLVVVIPITSERMQVVFTKMQVQAKSGGAAVPVGGDMTKFTAIAGGVTSVVTAILASIYPALALVFLSLARSRAACLGEQPAKRTTEMPMEWS